MRRVVLLTIGAGAAVALLFADDVGSDLIVRLQGWYAASDPPVEARWQRMPQLLGADRRSGLVGLVDADHRGMSTARLYRCLRRQVPRADARDRLVEQARARGLNEREPLAWVLDKLAHDRREWSA